jgi:protein-disulfide isomerase
MQAQEVIMERRPAVPVLLGLATLAGCTGGADLEELKKGQKDILAKLDSLDKAIHQVKVAPAAQPPGPAQPDPNKVYTIPLANSAVKGPQNAKVTIVEFSDFQ